MKSYFLIVSFMVPFDVLGMSSRQNLDDCLRTMVWSTVSLSDNWYRSQHYGSAQVDSKIRVIQAKLIKKMAKDRLKQIQQLLDRGASANIIIGNDLSALDIAISSGDTALVEMLLDKGADFKQSAIYGKNLIMQTLELNGYQLQKNRLAILRLLLDKGLNPNTPNQYGESALYLASLSQSSQIEDIVKLLIDKGGDINGVVQHYNKNTALHTAARQGDVSMLKLLLQLGANPTIKNEEGKTALDEARLSNYSETIESIQSRKAKEKIIKEYLRLIKEAESNPTAATVCKTVDGGYITLVQRLLKKVSLTENQVKQCGILAEEQFRDTNNSLYQSIGKLLREYLLTLKTLTGAYTQLNGYMPADIAQEIAKWSSGYVFSR